MNNTVKVYEAGNLTKAEANKRLVEVNSFIAKLKFGPFKGTKATMEALLKRKEVLEGYIKSK